jgi:CRP/FNR family transcriptional regulator, cyclic AMP receptor protein
MAASVIQGVDFFVHQITANTAVFYMIVAAAWLQTLAAVLSTFSKTMIRLRVASVLANIFGLAVAIVTVNSATLLRHIVILPIDLIRLHQMRKLVSNVQSASKSDLNVEWLKPFMRSRRFDKGAIIFRKGDVAHEAFLLAEGEIELPELSSTLSPGALFGELALFTTERARTATAVCRTDILLLSITYDQFEQLYFQNPEFGIYLLRLIVGRLRSDIALAANANSIRQI